MSEIFKISILTSNTRLCWGTLDKLHPNKLYIKYWLYTQHTSISGISFVKELIKLERDLNKDIIIDN